MRKITFNECPRPQFVRGGYEILDGVWDFAFDKEPIPVIRNEWIPLKSQVIELVLSDK